MEFIGDEARPCAICGLAHEARPTSMNVCVRTLQARAAKLEELARLFLTESQLQAALLAPKENTPCPPSANA